MIDYMGRIENSFFQLSSTVPNKKPKPQIKVSVQCIGKINHGTGTYMKISSTETPRGKLVKSVFIC